MIYKSLLLLSVIFLRIRERVGNLTEVAASIAEAPLTNSGLGVSSGTNEAAWLASACSSWMHPFGLATSISVKILAFSSAVGLLVILGKAGVRG